MRCLRSWNRQAFLLLLPAVLPLAAPGQTPQFQPLLAGHRVVCAEYASGRVYAGLMEGGVVEWDPATGQTLRILTRSDGLGGHRVADLARVGGALWVATRDGGLAVIDNPGTSGESMRVYSSQLSSLGVTAVTGRITGNLERLYYGTDGHGIGVITGRFPGAYYTTQDGLIDDTVVALAVSGNVLLVATQAGLSRFAENVFTNYPYSELGIAEISALEVGPDGTVWAATSSGIRRWNDGTRTLEHVFGGAFFRDMAIDGETIWAVTSTQVYRKQGDGNFEARPRPPVPDGLSVAVYAVTAGDGGAWFGGQQRDPQLVGSGVAQSWLAPAGDAEAERTLLPACQLGSPEGFGGAALDSHGRPWLGDSLGRGLTGHDGQSWYNVTHLGTEQNGFNGLFNWFGNILVMARTGEDLWFNQFDSGAIRFRPAPQAGGPELWDQVHPGNSGMRGRRFVALAAHPDGPIFFCTDGSASDADLGVDVLIDPQHLDRDESWLHLDPQLLGGNNVWAVGFERRDVVWFGIRDTGLQRWDINGSQAGPDDPLTWDDHEDPANWLPEPLNLLPGSSVLLEGTNAILRGPDGSLWAGGNAGLVNFRMTPALTGVMLSEWKEKTHPLVPGLLASGVLGLALDRNDHLWVLTTRGLNRLRLDTDPLIVDAYTDIATFLTLNPSLYSTGAIVPLPGPTYRHLAVSADGSRLVLSGSLGGALVTVPAAGDDDPDPEAMLAGLYLYPNPFPGDAADPLLGLGGLALEEGQRLSLEIFNMQGQILFQARDVPGTTAVWDGRNRQGRRVASGLYLVKLTIGQRSAVRTLAVTY